MGLGNFCKLQCRSAVANALSDSFLFDARWTVSWSRSVHYVMGLTEDVVRQMIGAIIPPGHKKTVVFGPMHPTGIKTAEILANGASPKVRACQPFSKVDLVLVAICCFALSCTSPRLQLKGSFCGLSLPCRCCILIRIRVVTLLQTRTSTVQRMLRTSSPSVRRCRTCST